MSSHAALQIAAFAEGPALTPAKLRFNALVKQIERTRQTLAAWQDHVPVFRRAHAQAFDPIAATLDAGDRAWAFALGAAMDGGQWTTSQRKTLCGLICDVAANLLHRHGGDTELRALFDRHSPIDFDTELRVLAEIDAAREDGEVPPQRRDLQAQLAAGSLRDIYRKLASALHPDRETDDDQRDAKTALMQRVNQAYDTQDLLALLALQLEIEQIDADHIAEADERRVAHYNHVLAEQLRDLLFEVDHLAWDFCDEFGVDPDSPLDPNRLAPILDDLQRDWAHELYKQKDRLRLLADEKTTQRWLNGERQQARRGVPRT